jgi:hypothetical protein
MKPMLLAFVAMALISVGASYTLHEMGFSAQDRTSGAAVRLD